MARAEICLNRESAFHRGLWQEMHSSHSSAKPQIDLMRPKRDDGCKVRKNDHREKEMLKKRLLVEEKNYPEYGNAFKETKKIVDADVLVPQHLTQRHLTDSLFMN